MPADAGADKSGTVTATVTNTIAEATLPVINADISSAGGDQQLSQTLTLSAHQTQVLHWTVNAANILFGRLILVNITQAQYADLPARQSACGIFIWGAPGLSGVVSFAVVFVLGLILIPTGATMWWKGHGEQDELTRGAASAGSVLAGFTTAGSIAALFRLWGLILFLDVVALILIVVIITEFPALPERKRQH